jgi:hypothetical protein
MAKKVQPDATGTSTVRFKKGTKYVVLYLPDGTVVDISISPKNGENHIKMYDDNGYSVMPMDSESRVRNLDVWGPLKTSSRMGSSPENVVTVEEEELRE